MRALALTRRPRVCDPTCSNSDSRSGLLNGVGECNWTEKSWKRNDASWWLVLHIEKFGRLRTFLVMQDEVLIRMSAVASLEEESFVMLQATNSAEALEVLSGHKA